MAIPVWPATSRDPDEWIRLSEEMSRQLERFLWTHPTGEALRAFLESQEHLITSLPLDAARRVHQLTLENLSGGGRSINIVDEILRTGEVTRARATLIARTETARTASGLTQVRSQSVGSEGYIWRTAHDSDVRKEHRKLEGKFVRWDTPPVADKQGRRYHAGQGPNCRCFAEVVLPKWATEDESEG